MDQNDELVQALQDAQVYTQSFLPIAAAYCRSLGLIELVNRMVPSQMEVTPGHVVQAMGKDVLSGRTPLYRVEYFLEKQRDRELLLGEDLDAHLFTDTNLARSMDAINTTRGFTYCNPAGSQGCRVHNKSFVYFQN